MGNDILVFGVRFPLLWLFLAISIVALVLVLTCRAIYQIFFPAPDVAAEDEGSLVDRVRAKQPRSWADRLDFSFARLIRWTMLAITPQQALAAILIVGLVAAGGCYLLTWNELAAAGAFFAGLGLTVLFFIFLRSRWRTAIAEELPDGLFLLARSLRAGLTFEQATAASGKMAPEPLATEFRRCGREMEMGMPPAVSFQKFADNSGVNDLDSLAAVVSLHQRIGGNLPALLDRLASGVRDRIQFRGYLRSATVLSRLSATAVTLAGPVIAIIYALTEPAIFQNFFKTQLGWILFGLALVLEVIGALWVIFLIRRIEY